MTDKNDLPWDMRPVTARDIAITAGVAVVTILAGIVAIYLALGTSQASTDKPPPIAQPEATAPLIGSAQASAGGDLFQDRCASCHTIGEGRLVGPDLQGVSDVREQAWLLEWIQTPDQMIARKDPIAVALLEEYNNLAMPNLGISESDASALIQFIKLESGDTAELPPVGEPTPVAVEGDPIRGEAFFTGLSQLSNGGPACMGCHSISGVGELGGGTLGPDLTQVSSRYGPVGLTAALEGLPFPTMQGVFVNKPLTPQEVADLHAFFIESESSVSTAPNLIFVGIGLVALVTLGALSHLVWRRRLRGVRIPLVGR